LHSTIVWVFLNCFKWYLCIMHMLNKLVSTEVSFARLAWSALFEISEAFDALSAFTHLIICFTSFFVMRELNETVRNVNDFAMLLTFAWEDERKNFSRSISIFFSNVVVIWSMSLHFSDENWESFLDSWLSILAHFAKHHINLNALLSSCICDLKCMHFICWMILFLWSLCFRYSFHAFNVFIKNMLYMLHATYIKHNLYADSFLRLEKLLRENFLWQIHSSRWIKSFTAQISTVYFLNMSCSCFICNTNAYRSWFLL